MESKRVFFMAHFRLFPSDTFHQEFPEVFIHVQNQGEVNWSSLRCLKNQGQKFWKLGNVGRGNFCVVDIHGYFGQFSGIKPSYHTTTGHWLIVFMWGSGFQYFYICRTPIWGNDSNWLVTNMFEMGWCQQLDVILWMFPSTRLILMNQWQIWRRLRGETKDPKFNT